ncbi:Tetratricopeptide-like helical domain [Cinara cedri]|uniref:Tetratricopeptide-like helical domain n=1 Tax=Cinara cedri TaxID=506608 RepID=A0A5E4M1F1_9HEMI|nr:Tetratricopeptide-like helical domain [Cinara cedri]
MAKSNLRADMSMSSIADAMSKISASPEITDYVDGYENPVAWYRRYKVPRDKMTNDVLFDNIDMRDITLAQYDSGDKPESVKWKLFGHNTVICHEYITQGIMDQAIKSIGYMEEIVLSITDNDEFLKSIRIALNHITFSLKGHVMKLCSLDTENLDRFIMLNNMNIVNKSGLFGVQTFFFYEYGLPCAHITKDCALKAISINEAEPEWYYLLARVLTHWQRVCGSSNECSEQEFEAAKMAVKLGNKDHHKLHLIHIYVRMSKNVRTNNNDKANYIKEGLKLLKEVMSSNNDLLLLKSCLISLSKMSCDKYNNLNSFEDVPSIIKTLINKLEKSNNGYVHGAIGNYYLFNKKDYKKANYHLKKAFDAKNFGSSIDYIYTFFKMNPETPIVEPMLVDLLKVFPHPVHREKILSLIVSYLILTKDDIIQALKYIPALLNIKNPTCVYSLMTHSVKFSDHYYKNINLLDLLSEELKKALNDTTLTSINQKRVIEVQNKLEMFNKHVGQLMKEKEHIFGSGFRKVTKKNNTIINKHHTNLRNEKWARNNNQKDITHVKNYIKKEDNWRTLKPDTDPKSNIFSRVVNKQISKNEMEVKPHINDTK